MKIAVYKEAVKLTMKDLGPVQNVCHMALGMASELGELFECLNKEGGLDIQGRNLEKLI